MLAYPWTERAAPSPRNVLVVWDLIAGKERFRLPGESVSAAFSPDGKLLATGTPFHAVDWPKPLPAADVKLWDATTGQLVATLPSNGAAVWWLAFSPDGRHLLVTGDLNAQRPGDWHQGFFRVWRMADRTPGPLLKGAVGRRTFFLPDAQGFVTWRILDDNQNEERVCQQWDTGTCSELRRVNFGSPPDDSQYGVIDTSPNGKYAVVIHDRNMPPPSWLQWLSTRFGWRSNRVSHFEVVVADMQTGQRFETLRLSSQHPKYCMCEAYFSADGKTLLTIDADQVSVWELPFSRPWLHILGWPLLPTGLWLLWHWRRVRLRETTATSEQALVPGPETG